MNLPNLAAIVLISLAICLTFVGLFFGSIPLVEDIDSILGDLQEPFRSTLTDSPWLTASIVFGLIGFPASILAMMGLALWWFVGLRHLARRPPRSLRRVVVGNLAGLLLITFGLVPLLWILPTAVMAPVTIPAQRAAGEMVPARYPVLVFSMIMAMFASGPLCLGSGFLTLARLDRKALRRAHPESAETEAERLRRQRWNLRLEHLGLLLVCGVALTLAVNGMVLILRVLQEYPLLGQEPSARDSLALTPEAYVGGALLLGIPAVLLAFLLVGIRVLLVRPEPDSAERAPAGS